MLIFNKSDLDARKQPTRTRSKRGKEGRKQKVQEGGQKRGRNEDIRELKVTVQFETEGNGQNEIVSHMDRSEVKL